MAASDDRAVQPSRDCTVPGCGGTMRFNPPRREAQGLQTLEWPWLASWECDRDPSHCEVATADERGGVARRGDTR